MNKKLYFLKKSSRKSSYTGRLFFLLLVFLLMITSCGRKAVIKIAVKSGEKSFIDQPVSLNLQRKLQGDEGKQTGLSYRLYEVTPEKEMPVAFHIVHAGTSDSIIWVVNGVLDKGMKRFYELRQEKVTEENRVGEEEIKIIKDGKTLKVTIGGKEVVQYNSAPVPPPEGVSSLYTRGAFIHPLYSPKGSVLTRINPPDHYHHMGIWNPWTHVLYKGDTIDFWNIGGGQATVRFSDYENTEENDVYASFKAWHDHVILPSETREEEVPMKELWDINVWNIGKDRWLIDFTSSLDIVTENPVTLLEYRYGGFGFRGTEQWNTDNSYVLTSEGKTRKDADATDARWAIVGGETDLGESGILFMGHPDNFNFPEPMRVWPENAQNGIGNVFFSFSPTRDRDWPMATGKSNVLRYRMYVFDGELSPEKAETLWRGFAGAPEVKVIE